MPEWAIKDKNSVWVSSISQKTSYRNPDLEATVIKATSHDESFVDFKNFQRVYLWLRTSPLHLKPLVWSLSTRMEKTRSWVVALKGLMLMHGVFCCNLPNAKLIGRLPFDLSTFSDGHSKPSKTGGFNAFVRAYFVYLDQKSAFISSDSRRKKGIKKGDDREALIDELKKLMKLQAFLDSLIQIKPEDPKNMRINLIKEAMTCILTEISQVYTTICRGIDQDLLRIHSSPPSRNKEEASMALEILRKAKAQGEKLSLYFVFCTDFGVIKESECPKIEQIRDEDIREVEKIVNGNCNDKELMLLEEGYEILDDIKDMAIVVRPISNFGTERVMTTIITDKWEVFDDHDEDGVSMNNGANSKDPFAASYAPENKQLHHFPDLISF
ncbi:hypothetical protein FEM48_Zijuj10G0110500 [Ziziphus jujuba var. spinosa]|uniref:ENTH domain-containing protein n=1 Tax=Ziziphus jujuba var. spinosa TaxID=714518 RepID=A0A978UN02_ZIZJJ|nr:hypothetical protein FEM48_Zijuj10G0110500 [Ziziphus jujuba var. spinosa]